MVIEDRRDIVVVSGSLCYNAWPVIRTSALLAFDRNPAGIMIDFSGVRWLSRAGEETLTAAIDEIERARLPFLLLNVSPAVEPLLPYRVARHLYAGSELWWQRLCGAE